MTIHTTIIKLHAGGSKVAGLEHVLLNDRSADGVGVVEYDLLGNFVFNDSAALKCPY